MMRLATFNVMHGRSIHDGRVEPDRLREAIAGLDADVLGLQEVDHGQPRSGHLDQTALAAEAVGAPGFRFAPAVVGTPGQWFRPAVPEEPLDGNPQYGNALVSRWPVLEWHVTRLAAAPVRSPVIVPGRVMLLPDEPRVLLAAVVETPVGPMTLATTHLSFVPGWNVRQLRTAVRALRRLPAPRVLLGDLNLPAPVARAVSRWRPAVRRPTYPSPGPRVQLDHILIDPLGWPADLTVTAAGTPEAAVSDHRPLVVQFG